MQLSKRFLSALMVCTVLVTPFLSTHIRATTIAQLDFAEVLTTAELVFEGRVVHVEAQETGPRSIHTIVRFEVLDVLKGDYRPLQLELQYLGGQVGTRRLDVQSMQIPELGEHGFYFVESLQNSMVHPLVGWSQGHFLIEVDAANEEKVFTADQQAVSDIIASPVNPTANAPAILGHDGSSRGVVVQGLSAPAPAMTAQRFKELVRESLDAQTLQGTLP